MEERKIRDKEDFSEVEVGLYCPLIDAFTLINKLFNKDFFSGINIMKKLLPHKQDITRKDFLTYNMASKMSRLGRSP